MRISIVIPSLCEEIHLRQNILPLLGRGFEIIVVEAGGLSPISPEILWIPSDKKNRAYQMNLGAAKAQGDLLIFLHADTSLSPGAVLKLGEKMCAHPEYIGGAFRFRLDHFSMKAKMIEWGVRIRERLWKLPYGDQAIFVRKNIFEELGRYPEVEILEDVLFIQKLKQRGKLLFFKEKALTSARRWEEKGFVKMTLLNWMTMIKWKCGYPLSYLALQRRGHRS